jgi:hypothetical protein
MGPARDVLQKIQPRGAMPFATAVLSSGGPALVPRSASVKMSLLEYACRGWRPDARPARLESEGLRMARYDSFLLRIWRSTRQDGSQLAAHLQHLQSGESIRYADSESLLAYLSTLLDADGEGPSQDRGPGKHDAQ